MIFWYYHLFSAYFWAKFKTMNKILTIAAVMALLFACNTGNKNTDSQEVRNLTIDAIQSSASEFENQTVQVTGMVLHVCKHGGQKMFLTTDSTETSLLVRVGPSIPEFEVTLEGSTVEVTGKLVATVVSNTEEEHEGEGHGTAASAEPEDCPTEQTLKAAGEGEECTTTITYHLEAASFKEIL
jgi:hypothetical protein